MHNTVIICTVAYNAEKTLSRAVDSVLSQTHENLVYYLVDNGSTDKTGEIVRSYAQKDNRVIPHFNERNHEWTPGSHWQDFARKYDNGCYFCSLDADDEYKPNALEKMLSFAHTHHLDIVACGSDFIDAKTDLLLGSRAIDDDLLISGDGFSRYLPTYHQFLRTFWGKLFSLRVFKSSDLEFAKTLKYGSDTAYVLEISSHSASIGVLGGTLHKYYVNPKSASYVFEIKRVESDRFLDDGTRKLLVSKCGWVSPQNLGFLLMVYMNALKDTWNVLLSAQIEVGEKLNNLQDMLGCDQTKQLAALEDFGDWFGAGPGWRKQRREFFATVANWLLSLQEVPDEQVESFCDMGELACAAAEHADGWVFFNKLRVQVLIGQGRSEEARAKLDELAEVLPADADLAAIRTQLV